MKTKPSTQPDQGRQQVSAETLRQDSNTLLGAGVGIGAIGALGALVGGAVCPVCIVATPALIGAGVVQRVRSARSKRARDASAQVIEQRPDTRGQVPAGSR